MPMHTVTKPASPSYQEQGGGEERDASDPTFLSCFFFRVERPRAISRFIFSLCFPPEMFIPRRHCIVRICEYGIESCNPRSFPPFWAGNGEQRQKLISPSLSISRASTAPTHKYATQTTDIKYVYNVVYCTGAQRVYVVSFFLSVGQDTEVKICEDIY